MDQDNQNKKIIMISLMFLLCLTITSAMAVPPDYAQNNKHYYSVLLDGEGEAIVNLKINFLDRNKPLNSYFLEIPYENVRLLGVYERTLDTPCIEWGQICTKRGEGSTCVQYDYNGDCLKQEGPCLKYEKTCNKYDRHQKYSYEKLDVQLQKTSNHNLLDMNLKQSSTINNAKELLVIVKIDGSVKNSLGKKIFSFETFATDTDLSTVRVGVNVPDGYSIKDQKSKVNYKSNFLKYNQAIESSKSLSNDEMQTFSNHIVSYNQFSKSTNYLDPFETFTVNMKYSKSWFALNWHLVLLYLIIFGVLITLIAFGVIKLKQNLKFLEKKNQKKKISVGLTSFLGGLFVSLALLILWVVIILLMKLIQNNFNHDLESLLALFLILFGVIVTLFLMISTPIFVGNKYSIKMGFYLALWMFGWIFFIFIFSVIILGTLFF